MSSRALFIATSIGIKYLIKKDSTNQRQQNANSSFFSCRLTSTLMAVNTAINDLRMLLTHFRSISPEELSINKSCLEVQYGLVFLLIDTFEEFSLCLIGEV